MNQPYMRQPDPAVTAAGLMQRMGFMILLTLLPCLSTLSRRATIILFPTAIGFFLVSLVIVRHKPAFTPLKSILFSVPALSGGCILLWSGLSLLWTPYVPEAWSRMADFLFALFLLVTGYWALPERVRASNVNLLPVGLFLSIVCLLWITVVVRIGFAVADPELYVRSLLILLLFLWPTLAWLYFRNHRVFALCLIFLFAGLLYLSGMLVPQAAFVIGLIIFLLAQINRSYVAYGLCVLITLLFFGAPLLGFFVPTLKELAPNVVSYHFDGYEEWSRVIMNDPLRLITGYGLETTARRYISASLPTSLIFSAWFELGIVGVTAATVLCVSVIIMALRSQSLMAPGIFATLGTAYVSSLLGVRGTQPWWFTTVAALILVYVTLERSHFRTQRPLAFFRSPTFLKKNSEVTDN